MKRNDPKLKKPAKGKSTIITLACHPDDAEAIKQAFADGLLADLGVTDVRNPNSTDPQIVDVKVDWAAKSGRGRSKPEEPSR